MTSNETFRQRLKETRREAGFLDAAEFFTDPELSLGRRRSGGSEPDDVKSLALIQDAGGILRWQEWQSPVFLGPGRRASQTPAPPFTPGSEVLVTEKYRALEPNQVVGYLQALDLKLNGNLSQGACRLRELRSGFTLVDAMPRKSGRILLVVHGTFSNTDGYFSPSSKQAWTAHLQRVRPGSGPTAYDQVLAFDHPTLSVSPLLNALDLARLFRDSKAEVDIVCHSRGGLVVRWWLELLRESQSRTRTVFVGSPLTGTSLASPANLRNALNLMTNYARALETVAGLASAALPFLHVVRFLLRIVGSLGTIGSKTPLLDGAIALIPGLAGQARVSNSLELQRLSGKRSTDDYFAILSDFQSEHPGWRFWKHFTQRALDKATDLVFDGPNDLVVDTASMTGLSMGMTGNITAIRSFHGPDVHHVNYFDSTEAMDFLRASLS